MDTPVRNADLPGETNLSESVCRAKPRKARKPTSAPAGIWAGAEAGRAGGEKDEAGTGSHEERSRANSPVEELMCNIAIENGFTLGGISDE